MFSLASQGFDEGSVGVQGCFSSLALCKQFPKGYPRVSSDGVCGSPTSLHSRRDPNEF